MDKQREDGVKNNTWRFQRNKERKRCYTQMTNIFVIFANKHCNYTPLPLNLR